MLESSRDFYLPKRDYSQFLVNKVSVHLYFFASIPYNLFTKIGQKSHFGKQGDKHERNLA